MFHVKGYYEKDDEIEKDSENQNKKDEIAWRHKTKIAKKNNHTTDIHKDINLDFLSFKDFPSEMLTFLLHHF